MEIMNLGNLEREAVSLNLNYIAKKVERGDIRIEEKNAQ